MAGASMAAKGPGSERQWRDALAQGRFTVPVCDACGRAHFFPRVICPHCGADTITMQPASGRGTVYSTTVLARKPDEGGDLNIAMIDLAEGARMMSRVDGIGPAAVAIGLHVEARIVTEDGVPVVVFVPAVGEER